MTILQILAAVGLVVLMAFFLLWTFVISPQLDAGGRGNNAVSLLNRWRKYP